MRAVGPRPLGRHRGGPLSLLVVRDLLREAGHAGARAAAGLGRAREPGSAHDAEQKQDRRRQPDPDGPDGQDSKTLLCNQSSRLGQFGELVFKVTE